MVGDDPCHLITNSAAFNMSNIAAVSGGSNIKDHQELFYVSMHD
jgi:hypothetical protein